MVAHWAWSTAGFLSVQNGNAFSGGVIDFAGAPSRQISHALRGLLSPSLAFSHTSSESSILQARASCTSRVASRPLQAQLVRSPPLPRAATPLICAAKYAAAWTRALALTHLVSPTLTHLISPRAVSHRPTPRSLHHHRHEAPRGGRLSSRLRRLPLRARGQAEADADAWPLERVAGARHLHPVVRLVRLQRGLHPRHHARCYRHRRAHLRHDDALRVVRRYHLRRPRACPGRRQTVGRGTHV